MLASTSGGHSDFVMSNARGVDHAAIAPIIARSWHRSLDVHRLDPQRAAAPRVLTGGSLREHQDPMESLMQIAKGGMESLFLQVREAGYIVLLTDHHGVAVDFQTSPMSQQDLRRAGLYLGSCWSESEEGTCAVGTCIVDNSTITVHQGEHFRITNTKLTCSAAPILDPDGKLLAVLDASALYSPDDKRSQALVLQLVSTTAKMLRIFVADDARESFTRADGTSGREVITLSHFASGGELERQFSVWEGDAVALPEGSEIEWTPTAITPSADGTLVRFWFVARDGRGGLSFRTRAACVVQ